MEQEGGWPGDMAKTDQRKREFLGKIRIITDCLRNLKAVSRVIKYLRYLTKFLSDFIWHHLNFALRLLYLQVLTIPGDNVSWVLTDIFWQTNPPGISSDPQMAASLTQLTQNAAHRQNPQNFLEIEIENLGKAIWNSHSCETCPYMNKQPDKQKKYIYIFQWWKMVKITLSVFLIVWRCQYNALAPVMSLAEDLFLLKIILMYLFLLFWWYF